MTILVAVDCCESTQKVVNKAQEIAKALHFQIQQIAKKLRNEAIETTALLIQDPRVETIVKEAKKLAVELTIFHSI